ncbi:MAG: hypothetical protein II574_09370, partial [Ruminococcus sp.]|nr:hypothetical protein [Ruminococcus sp.]
MSYDDNKPETTGGYDSPHKDEYDRMVEQIKAKRKAMSKSIWTDEPLLKPYKSIWIDDDDAAAKSEPAAVQSEEPSAPEPQIEYAFSEPVPEPQPEADPFNA